MPISFPYIPQTITVHLGSPDSPAANVTVAFPQYIKNVVSSEIYPTWEQSAITANTLAIVSYALNRIYTEFYRSRGYDFDITSSTAIDQKFIQGRNIFENVSQLVDSLFDDYIRRIGFIEPLAAKFCNGTTVTCSGLSQWGSQELAQSGQSAYSILQNYYGDDIEIVRDANIRGIRESYPGAPLKIGDTGTYVSFLQTELNRISQNYPAIPKVPVDGIFGQKTDEAVRAFQPIFSLTSDGVVGRSTWYRVVQVYVAVLGLSELQSQGLTYSGISWEYPDAIVKGDRGIKVAHMQYMLSVIGEFIAEVPPLEVNGSFDDATLAAVTGFQRYAGLDVNGVVGADTWDTIYSQFEGINARVFGDAELFPFSVSATPAQNISELQKQLTGSSQKAISAKTPQARENKAAGARRCAGNAPRQQSRTGAPRTDEKRSTAAGDEARLNRYQFSSRFPQHPRQTLSAEMSDQEMEI